MMAAKGTDMDKVREALAAAKQSVPHQGEPEANWCLIEKRHLETLCDAAREALSAQPAEPDCWQVSDFDVVDGWSGWRAISYGDLAGYQRLIQNHPGKYRLRPLYAAAQPAPSEPAVMESAWLIEWRAHGFGPQWWGFNYEPGRHGMWCSDANNAIRFSRREDAERMRLHVIAARDLTGQHTYEQQVTVSEHEWPLSAQPAPSEPAAPAWISVHDRLPDWTDDSSVRVVVYTEGYDFGGVQVHDIQASDFYYNDNDAEEGTEVTRYASHWVYRDEFVRLAAAPHPAAKGAES